jgi:hypothetical protein
MNALDPRMIHRLDRVCRRIVARAADYAIPACANRGFWAELRFSDTRKYHDISHIYGRRFGRPYGAVRSPLYRRGEARWAGGEHNDNLLVQPNVISTPP